MSSVRRSLLLTAADSYFGFAVQLASTVVIARILSPHEIGVFAVAAVFSMLASMFRDFGVAEYLIQEKELNAERIAAALSLNIAVSWTMALAMLLGGPLVAHFYREPGVAEVMRIQAIGFVLVPFGAVTMAYLRRELRFGPQLVCNMAGTTAGFVVAVSLALSGWGAPSLAWSTVSAIAVTVALSLFFRPAEFPRWPGLAGIGRVFEFSKFASAIYIVAQLGKGMPELIIGRAAGMVEVAMFSRGGGLVQMFRSLAMRPLSLVCMPYLARAEREQGSMREAYLRSVSYVTALGWPAMAFLALAAFAAVRIVYGPQWDAAVPLAQLLCLAFAFELVHSMSREALLSKGMGREANRLELSLLGMQAVGLLAVFPFGLVGAAAGLAAASAAGLVLSQRALASAIGITWGDLVSACAPSLALCGFSVAVPALWIVWAGVGPDNYVLIGVGGGLLTALFWLLGLKVVGHPIGAELQVFVRYLPPGLARRIKP